MKTAIICLMLAASTASTASTTAAQEPDDALYACKKPPAGAKLRLSFKPESTLRDVVVWATSFSCKTIIFADRLAAGERITIVAPDEMTSKQAWNAFLAALDAHDLVAVEKGNIVTIKDKPGAHRCVTATAPPPPEPPMPPPGAAPPPPPPDEPLDPAVANAISRVGADHYRITRDGLVAARANSTQLARSARIVPSMKEGKAIGFKLYAIRPGSFYARLGLENGDTLVSLNGRSLSTPDQALEAYSKIRDASRIELGLLRRGEPRTIVYDIIP